MVKIKDWMKKFVPMVLHGDGVRFSMKSNSRVVVSLSLLSQGFSSQVTFMLWCFAKVCRVYESVHGADTHDIIWKYCVHGFQALFDGIHPLLDPDGHEWPEGSPAWVKRGKQIADGLFRRLLLAICTRHGSSSQ